MKTKDKLTALDAVLRGDLGHARKVLRLTSPDAKWMLIQTMKELCDETGEEKDDA